LQVVLAPDPDLAEHLLLHGVMLTHTSYEGDRLQRAFLIQVREHAHDLLCCVHGMQLLSSLPQP
jgi:hypothetical protein